MPITRTTHRRNTQSSHTSAAANDLLRLDLGPLTDAASIQQAISSVVCAVATGELECDRARLILYGLRIAATNAKHLGEAAKKPGVNRKPASREENAGHDNKHEAMLPLEDQAEQPADDETAHEPCKATADRSTDEAPSGDDASDDASFDEEICNATTATPEEEPAIATARPQRNHGEIYIPPSCFAPAHKLYQGNARERILNFRQQRT